MLGAAARNLDGYTTDIENRFSTQKTDASKGHGYVVFSCKDYLREATTIHAAYTRADQPPPQDITWAPIAHASVSTELDKCWRGEIHDFNL